MPTFTPALMAQNSALKRSDPHAFLECKLASLLRFQLCLTPEYGIREHTVSIGDFRQWAVKSLCPTEGVYSIQDGDYYHLLLVKYGTIYAFGPLLEAVVRHHLAPMFTGHLAHNHETLRLTW